MSIKSWKNEFYPTSAENATDSDERAINHSLLKWSGALKDNVMRHKVHYSVWGVREIGSGKSFTFESKNCALCVRYRIAKHGDENCFNSEFGKYCPIVRASGKPCDGDGWINWNKAGVGLWIASTWFRSCNDPTPMLALLGRALARVLKRR